jgi:hypothetical protein
MDYEPTLKPSLDVLFQFTPPSLAAHQLSLELALTGGPPSDLTGRDVRTRICSLLC